MSNVKIWLDPLTPKQTRLMISIGKKLREQNHTTIYTTRNYDYIHSTFHLFNQPFTSIGEHGGKTLKGKLVAYAKRVLELAEFISTEQPDVLISFSSPSAVRVAFGLGIPIITLNDTPHAIAVGKLTLSQSDYLVYPQHIPAEKYLQLGAHPDSLRPYNGVDEVEWTKNFEPDESVLEEIGLQKQDTFIVFRPEESNASYYQDHKSEYLMLLSKILEYDPNLKIVFFPRYPSQKTQVETLNTTRIIVPRKSIDTLSLFKYAKLTITGGGTISRESALLGTPAISYFPKTLDVNEFLKEKGFPIYHATSVSEAFSLMTKLYTRPHTDTTPLLNHLESPYETVQAIINEFK